MTVTEFLEARIAEDEYEANVCLDQYRRGEGGTRSRWMRQLAECAAKRAIADDHAAVRDENWMSGKDHDYLFCGSCGSLDDAPVPYPCATLAHLAAIYADHPDYDQEWAL